MKTEEAFAFQQHNLYIMLIDVQTREQWRLDARIIECSEFLIHMDRQDSEGNILTIDIPAFLKATSLTIKLIHEFYLLHHYKNSSVHVSKIKVNKWQKSFDPISLKYVNEYLKQRGEQEIKDLINLCEFLKLNSLKQVLCTVIAHRNYFNHNENNMKKQLEEGNICYSRIMEINLKRGLMDYAKQFGKEALDNYRKKMAQKYQNTRP